MTQGSPTLLLVDDEPDVLFSLRRLLDKHDYRILEATNGAQALALIRTHKPDVVLMDVRMPEMDGITALREIKKIEPRLPVILMTAYATTQSTIEAMKLGAFDYVIKPFQVSEIRDAIAAAVKVSRDMRRQVAFQTSATSAQDEGADEIIGLSEPMREVYKLIGRLAASDLPVLITGESGTGKELVARAIYQHSRRREKPFLAINCAAIPETLLESELFGYQRGAFTGATAPKPGKFEVCDGGTIFLDEIGEMPLATQKKLLRVLETGEIEKIGGIRPAKVDVRILAATNRDLEERIQAGEFRADLYFRLRVVEVRMPPLRERVEDIPLLADYFLRRAAGELGIPKPVLTEEAIDALQNYNWPGNVRELENVIKNCLVRLQGNRIYASDLDLRHTPSVASGTQAQESRSRDLIDSALLDELFERIVRAQPLPEGFDAFDVVERSLLERALRYCGGNKSKAAKLLGVTRNTVRKRVEKYGLSTTDDPTTSLPEKEEEE
ncbi:MAG: sigma-54 dependent transcriptional regulator [Candidatus Sumerlaea chitinivorans]|nr:sigma-54 dependent transcriptional regulator [Candidatus Sumerlaea chitinivorans]